MPLKKQTETQRGIFTIKEYLYDSGLVEISFFTGELIPGAGPILRGVISRQPGKGCKYVGYTSRRNRVAIGLKRAVVIDSTIREIEADMLRDGSLARYTLA